MPLTDKLSDNLKHCLKQANRLAARQTNKTLTLNLFLSALFEQKGSIAFELLNQQQIDPAALNRILVGLKSRATAAKINQRLIKLDPAVRKMLLQAFVLARKHGHFFVGTEHCLAVLLNNPPPSLKTILTLFHLDKKRLVSQVHSMLRGNSKFPELTHFFQNSNNQLDEFNADWAAGLPPPSPVELFATDITEPKYQESINPVIKRENEIERLIQILCRKDKNNPVILGDPGVGKTALIEGLAKKILAKQVPAILMNKKILSLDLSLVIAGTMYRGDFENRLKMILDEVKRNPNIIIFIDELHNIVGAGSASGSMDAANILKPLLARGELRCIGATTLEEYKKFIEKDAALDRRFQPIIITEPDAQQAIQILHGIKDNYQRYHSVQFTDQAITAAVIYSQRYIQDKLLPDKAIDLIDEAAAKQKILAGDNEFNREIRALENELAAIRGRKSRAVLNEEFNVALNLKQQEKVLTEKINYLNHEQEKNAKANPQQIDRQQILEIIAQKTRIPLSELLDQERAKIKNLPVELKKSVIGQDAVIEEATAIISRAKLGLADENRPLASFLFLGASGAGKTHLSKKLAQTLFHDKDSFIRIDMSEFSEKFTAASLVGAPAGYVGFREGAKLTDAVKKRPYSLILFDEIEKAHPDILNLLLQVLEDGHLTDATGKQINFKNTIIVMTSNFGSQDMNKKANIGFGGSVNDREWQNKIISQAKQTFKPEFINRIDKILFFNPLDNHALQQIIRLEIQQIAERLTRQGLALTISEKKIRELAKIAAELDSGARGVKKALFDQVEKPITERLLHSKQKNFDL